METLPPQLSSYRPSGAAPVAGVVMTLIAGIAAGVVMGAVYAFINHHNPIIYLNILLVFGFGWALGLVVAKGVSVFHIRNRVVAAVAGVIIFGVAYVAHWCVYIPTVLIDFDRNTSSFDVRLILETAVMFARYPMYILEWILRINESGVWSVTMPGSRTGGIEVSGLVLALVWLAEAVIIGYFAVKMPWEQAGEPYSERRQKWLTAKVLAAPIAFIENVEEFLNKLARGDYSALATPLAAITKKETEENEKNEESEEVTSAQYASVTLYPDSFEPYVSVQNISTSAQKGEQVKPAGGFIKKIGQKIKGWFIGGSEEDSVSVSDVVRYLKISPTVAQNISNALGVEKSPA